jgi:hypothetical protein
VTAAELLTRLRADRVEVRVQGDTVLCRPRTAVTAELRREIVAHKPELVALLTAPAAAPALDSPSCGRRDYWPVGGGWRRCWRCGRRWGPVDSPDPGDPPDLLHVAERLGIRAGRGRPGR